VNKKNNNKKLFYSSLAQTSASPVGIEIVKAQGIYLYDNSGKEYIDMISGISVNNLGHLHPEIVNSIKDQLDRYLHVMCYGELIQAPQVQLADLLTKNLPDNLNSVYLVNSGSEAVEGALKLAKRFTGRSEMISFRNAYHGSTQGALSVCGNEDLKNSFRPLLPNVSIFEFNNIDELSHITNKTACVIIEPIQGEAGVRLCSENFLKKLRVKCSETGALLIFDEVQTGFGRTGKLWAFQHYNVIPDIITLAKSMGGGLPIGAFISSNEIMKTLTYEPVLGHITTFGGHPLSCAAAIANLNYLINSKIIQEVSEKEKLCHTILKHPAIKAFRSKGLLMALKFENEIIAQKIMKRCFENGIITDSFLFSTNCLRVAPPLIISEIELKRACELILKSIKEIID